MAMISRPTGWALSAFITLSILIAAPVSAQDEPPPPPPEESFVPPTPKGEVTVRYPEDAPEHENPVDVTVLVLVGEDGLVVKTTLVSSSHPELQIFIDAVLQQATAFEFEPAQYQGEPVPVEIEFTHSFLPPEPEVVVPEELVDVVPEETEEDAGPRAYIIGKLEEKGTRDVIDNATVLGRVEGEEPVTTKTNDEGVFVLEVAPGEVELEIFASEHQRFLQRETVAEDEALKVGYLLERRSYNPYEIVVFGEAERSEVSRTTLRGKEIKRVPGTFGDPFRVIQSLPGVTSIVSLLPFPVVHGSSPSSTGFLIDGVRVPLLFHLLAGPSVVNPEFIDEIRFYPGGFPLEYGRYTGGIVDGRTRPLYEEEFSGEIDVNLLQAGALFKIPTPWFTATVAGRYGFPGGFISLVTDDLSLQYWDYQVRLDGGDANSGWTIFAFGAGDDLQTRPAPTEEDPNPDLETTARFMFHRIDLRYAHRSEDFDGVYQVVFGVDDTLAGPGADLVNWYMEPRLQWWWRGSEEMSLHFGVDANTRYIQSQPIEDTGAIDTSDQLTSLLGSNNLTNAGAFIETRWELLDSSLVLSPGVRADLYDDGVTTVLGLDPRLLVRWSPANLDWGLDPEEEDLDALERAERSPLWLKAGVGLYHQPPRFLVPLPGLDQIALDAGLLEALQTHVGLELPLPQGLSVDLTAFYNDMDPMVFDLSVNPAAIDVQVLGPGTLPGELPEPDTDSLVDQIADELLAPTVGRSYGMEVLLRRQSPNGLYGWISYTLSRSERLQEDGTWAPFDYDRTHILNLVAGLPLPRNWDISLRLQYQSGRPVTITQGFNAARSNAFLRFDLRIDKRAVWNDWLLDFYLDITNATLFPEEIAPGNELVYVLPTLGVKALF